MSAIEVGLIISVPLLLALVWAMMLYRITALESVLRDLLAVIEEQGTRDDDMERLHVVFQAARKLVGQ